MFTWPIRVYYEDTDAGGVVYYANYLTFYERARSEFLRAIGFEQDKLITELSLIFVVRSVQIEYLQPVKFNTLMQVHSVVAHLKNASMQFEQSIEVDGEIVNTAFVRIACLDAQTLRPKLLPAEIKQALAEADYCSAVS